MKRREFILAMSAAASTLALGACGKSEDGNEIVLAQPEHPLDAHFPRYTDFDPAVRCFRRAVESHDSKIPVEAIEQLLRGEHGHPRRAAPLLEDHSQVARHHAHAEPVELVVLAAVDRVELLLRDPVRPQDHDDRLGADDPGARLLGDVRHVTQVIEVPVPVGRGPRWFRAAGQRPDQGRNCFLFFSLFGRYSSIT